MNKKRFSVASIGEIICVVVILAMTLLTFVNVCSRYIFHSSIAASEEITTNMFVVLSLVGAALALVDRSHIGLNILVDKFPPMVKTCFRIFEGAAGMFFLGFLTYYGYLRVRQQLATGIVSAGLAMPLWVYGVLCLMGFIIMLAVFAEIFISSIITLIKKSYDQPKSGKEEEK